jgi:hypothetical protein
MKLETIDSSLFLGKFKDVKSLKFDELDGGSFFNNLSTHNEFLASLVPKDVLGETGIYPPNIAVMDYIFKNIKTKDLNLLDYGCGIPKLMQLLVHAGYKNVRNYDNWSQVDKKFAVQFLENTELNVDSIVDSIYDTPHDINCVCHIGYPIVPKDFFAMLNRCEKLEYIMSDFRFTPEPKLDEGVVPTVKFEQKAMHVSITGDDLKNHGFVPIMIYDGLLVIYKRDLK